MIDHRPLALTPWTARIAKAMAICLCFLLTGAAAGGAGQPQGRGGGKKPKPDEAHGMRVWVDDSVKYSATAQGVAHLRGDVDPDGDGWVQYTDRRAEDPPEGDPNDPIVGAVSPDPCVTVKTTKGALFAHLNRGSGDPSDPLLNQCNEHYPLTPSEARTYTLVFPYEDPPGSVSCECEALALDDPDGDGFCSLTVATHTMDPTFEENGGLARIGTGSIFAKRDEFANVRFMFYHYYPDETDGFRREHLELESDVPLWIDKTVSDPGLDNKRKLVAGMGSNFGLRNFGLGQLCSEIEFHVSLIVERW